VLNWCITHEENEKIEAEVEGTKIINMNGWRMESHVEYQYCSITISVVIHHTISILL
jgi:hypothetical protein